MKTILATALVVVFTISAGLADDFFSRTDQFLKTFVNDGLIKYSAIIEKPDVLNNLVEQIANYDLADKSKNEQKAFYINAYNLLVIKSVVDNYPLNSPMDVAGFFDGNKHNIAGKKLTLNDLENKVIRPKYKDARIHFALVCAAKGCPKITAFAYMPESLDKQLEKQTKISINDPDFIRVNVNSKKVELSQIFQWYKEDFLLNQNSVFEYVNHYRNDKIPESYQIGFYEYDWSLNEKK